MSQMPLVLVAVKSADDQEGFGQLQVCKTNQSIRFSSFNYKKIWESLN